MRRAPGDTRAAPGRAREAWPATRWFLTAHPHRCLLIYPAPAWGPIRDKVLAGSSLEQHSALLKRLLVGFARDEEMDAAGRVLIAPELRSFAQLESRCIWWGRAITSNSGRMPAGRNSRRRFLPWDRTSARRLGKPSAFEHRCRISRCCSKKPSRRWPSPAGIYVDGTFGRGGHSRAVLAQLGPEGRLIAFDRDPVAIAAGRGSKIRASSWCMRRSRRLPRRWPSGVVKGRWRPAGPGVSSPSWTRRAGHELPLRRAARHENGYDPRSDCGGVAGGSASRRDNPGVEGIR